MAETTVREWERVRYDRPADRVGRVTLTRPEAANAQDYLMLTQLNEAFDVAARDEEVRVIVLAAEGRHFSSGHDLSQAAPDMKALPTIGTQCHFDAPGAEGYMAREAEMYVGLCWRWRNLSKPTIAQVQGKVIAGGLMARTAEGFAWGVLLGATGVLLGCCWVPLGCCWVLLGFCY